MNEPHWDRLINRQLDNVLTEAERIEFEALMLESASARRRFWQLAEVHGLAREAARLPTPLSDSPQHLSTPKNISIPQTWFRWGPLPAAAAGLLIGLLAASTVFANVMPSFIRTLALLRDGFEAGPAPLNTGVPNQPGYWSGDYAELTGAQQGVRPETGTKMLRYKRADFIGKTTPDSYIGDVYQLIDLRPYRQDFADGGAVVQVSAAFNAIAFPAGESYDCSATIYALDAETATNGSLNVGDAPNTLSLAMANNSHLKLDRLPETWQRLTAELRLPATTEFLLIRCGMAHSAKSQRRETFDGHFLDDVRVTLARRPQLP